MAREVAPLELPEKVMADVETPFRLDGKELFYFDLIAQEHIGIAGTEIEYYRLDVPGSTKDPAYNEPIERQWIGPYRIQAYASWPQKSSEPGSDGFRVEYRGSIWVPRKEFEDAHMTIPPYAGDVVRFWKIPFFDQIDENVPGVGFFFNVLNVTNDGHLFDSSNFVGFRMDVKRTTDFTPERRVTPP